MRTISGKYVISLIFCKKKKQHKKSPVCAHLFIHTPLTGCLQLKLQRKPSFIFTLRSFSDRPGQCLYFLLLIFSSGPTKPATFSLICCFLSFPAEIIHVSVKERLAGKRRENDLNTALQQYQHPRCLELISPFYIF